MTEKDVQVMHEDYEDYFMNQTLAGLANEWSSWHDEWTPINNIKASKNSNKEN